MEPHLQAALGEGLAGRPRPPVPLDAERRGHSIGSTGEGLATMAGVDAGGGGFLLVDVGRHWGHRQTANQSASATTPAYPPSPLLSCPHIPFTTSSRLMLRLRPAAEFHRARV